MPRSLQAQITRRAISPRFAIRIFLNGPDAKEGLSVFHRLAVLNELAFDDSSDVGFDLVHQLHGFDNAENFTGSDVLADTHERRRVRRSRFVKSADDGAFRVEELRIGFGRGSFRFQGRRGGGGRSVVGRSYAWRIQKYAGLDTESLPDAHAIFAALHFQFGDARIGNQLDQLADLFNCHATE